MAKFCESCGSKVNKGENFCQNCGALIDDSSDDEKEDFKENCTNNARNLNNKKTVNNSKKSSEITGSFVCSILGFVLAWAVFRLIFGIFSVRMSSVEKKEAKINGESCNQLVSAAFIIGWIDIALGIIEVLWNVLKIIIF